MVAGPRVLSGGRTIRARILLIAWVPSLALLIIGAVLAGYLAFQSNRSSDVAEFIGAGADEAAAGRLYLLALEKEVQLTGAVMADPKSSTAALDAQRVKTDQTLAGFAEASGGILRSADPLYTANLTRVQAAIGGMPALRKRIDAGTVTLSEAVAGYGQVMYQSAQATENVGRNANDAKSAIEATVASRLVGVSISMVLGNSLAAKAFSDDGLTEAEYQELVRTAGTYRSDLDTLVPALPPAEAARVQVLTASSAWQQQLKVEQAALGATIPAPLTADSTATGDGTGTAGDAAAGDAAGAANTSKAAPASGRVADLPITRRNWLAAADEVSFSLADLGLDHIMYGASLSQAVADRQLRQSLAAGGLLLLLAVGVLLLTTRESNKLIGRLRRLRSETLDLAQIRLPGIVARLRDGGKVEASEEIPPLDLGTDELGQVADAFNYSQRVAVAAAVREAETRAGLRTVFLNIAYRSQVIVHQQLSVLERAERFQEDPEQLKLLFELDHLATRSRRNAENLVILGGGQPGRRWRNPVTLLQIVRGAISEAQDYARVSTAVLPGLAIRGAAVADVIHLLAELVDNATAFSPPMSRVEVRGNLVGRGLVLEIEDQGLGIPADQLAELNQMLTEPPDFHVMALREEPRLGMFVVAQLARSQGIRVTLTPSPAYGGVKAVVLIPSELIDTSEMEDASSPLPRQGLTTATGRLSAVTDRPALVHSQNSPDSGSMDSLESLHERMALGGRDFTTGANGVPETSGETAPTGLTYLSGPGGATGPIGVVRAPGETGDALATGPSGLPSRLDRPRPENGSTGSAEGQWQGSIADQLDRAMPTLSPVRPSDPDHATSSTQPGLTVGGGRPDLPRRRRQAHLDGRLRTPMGGAASNTANTAEIATDPEMARNRMSAFQRGTRRGRAENADSQAEGRTDGQNDGPTDGPVDGQT